MYIKWGNDEATRAEVGTKSYYLREVQKLGIKVPEGFTLVTQSFLDFISESKIEVKDGEKEIEKLFAQAVIPDGIRDEITMAAKEIRPPFAVRSSSVIEDMERSSFAGLYDTFLNVEPENLFEAIKRCWQRAFSSRCLAHLKKMRFKTMEVSDMAMAVIIQEMIKPSFSGVMFTVNPVTGDGSKIFLEYTAGLSDGILSGRTNPISLVVDKVTDRIEGEDMLGEYHFRELVSLGRRIEKHFGCYQDIEWAIDEEITILQARPETVWNKR
jgi:pyruvate,water dikinase